MTARIHHRRGERGVTLIDAMLALAIIAIGGTGTLGLYRYQLAMNADARRMTNASALAQDLVENIALWNYGDSRLDSTNTTNDGDLGDTARRFELADPPYDHAEADLGATWTGLASQAPRYERYWNVSYVDGVDGTCTGTPSTCDAVRIAVIVRWPAGTSRWRRIVYMTTKLNPAKAL